MYFITLNSTTSFVHIYNIHPLLTASCHSKVFRTLLHYWNTMYVHTVLQNELKTSSANKCFRSDMCFCITCVELNLQKNIFSLYSMWDVKQKKYIFYTKLALNAFCPQNKNVSHSQHSPQYRQQYHHSKCVTVCIYRSAGTALK